MKVSKLIIITPLLLAAIAAAFVAGTMFAGDSMSTMSGGATGDHDMDHAAMNSGATSVDAMAASGETNIKYWVAPMDANFRRDKPGKSPMGMALIPVYDEPAENGSDVTISSAVEQNLGVRTAWVESAEFVQTVKAVGSTTWDESSVSMLHTRAEGWLEVFNITSVGDRVEVGEILFEVFSPMLVTAQNEFLIAKRSANHSLLRASETRLLSLGITESQIEQLSRSGDVLQRLPHRAMRSGVVTELQVRPGMYVMPATNIATLASDDFMWLNVNVFESDAAQLQVGKTATIWFDAFPSERFSGRISTIYPELEMPTRTVKVRIELPNAERRLKANMFARVELESDSRTALLVPREAVIRSGAGSRVITCVGEGRFNVAMVKTGSANGSYIEILEGLTEGDRVVTSGQFLLDAEANGEQAMARLMAEKSLVTTEAEVAK
jgi:Cu(I)/Ag(I) efflux system membrane fusion protein